MPGRRRLLALILAMAGITASVPAAGAASAVEFQLKGVLISPNSKSALINGRIAREGERVAGVEIVAIEEGAIRVLSGSEEFTMPVGSRAWLEPSMAPIERPAQASTQAVRTVKPGDTLSRIAEDYAGNGATLSQVIMALFEANPQAFAGNINRLQAGAVLRIPDIRAMQRRTAETAMAAVIRQTQEWQVPQILRARAPSPVMPAPVAATAETADSADSEYGPVQYGETLSEIAVRVSANGVSMHRMMTALFEANPHAFGENIDILREGAVLTVPPVDAIDPIEALAALN